MERVIKFRGMPWNTGEWIFGALDNSQAPEKTQIIQSGTLGTTVMPETVGQFTGLLDKNGTEIYEGDIVRDRYGVGSVKFHKCTFVLTDESDLVSVNGLYNSVDCAFDAIQSSHAEVIGNVHENPERLETADERKREVATGTTEDGR